MTKTAIAKLSGVFALSIAAAACASETSTEPNERERATETPRSSVSSQAAMTQTVTPAAPQSEAPEVISQPENKPEEAEEAPQDVFPDSFAGRMNAASERAARGDGEQALALYAAASELRPGHAMPYIEKARVLIDLGYHARARTHAERGVELYPSSSLAWNTLGRVELGERDLEAAAAAFRRAAEVNEDNSYAWNNLGFALLELGRYGEAADALEVATSGLEPQGYMWNNLGMAYEHLGELGKARAAYRQGMGLGSVRAETNLDRLEGVDELGGAVGDDEVEAEKGEAGV